jgi:hypothetical protein
MVDNRRLFYAIHQVGLAADGSTSFTAIHGAQSVGITTTFNLEQVYELGMLAIYDNIEQIPDVEVTLQKALDGNPLIYHLATVNAPSATLVGRSVVKTTFGLSVFSDTMDAASGVPIAEVQCSGMVISSLNFAFPTDGVFTESVTFVGNNKKWKDTGTVFTGAFAGNNDAPIGSGGTQHRAEMIFTVPSGSPLDVNSQVLALTTVLPTDIYGVNADGSNNILSGSGAHVGSITVSADLGRDQIFELGRKAPYFRYATFPIEVTTEIVVIGVKWDGISGTEVGGENGAPLGSNLKNQSIRVYTRDGTFLSMGTKNKLSSVAYSGGDAGGGGGNVNITYRYITYNDLTVKHPADPTVALRGGGAV